MELKECYAALGGNYDEVVGRFHGERLVRKFALKFLTDGSYALLENSLGDKNYSEAFRAAHTLKGVCQNLAFTRLYESSAKLTEALRNGWSAEAEALVDPVREDYAATVAALRALDA